VGKFLREVSFNGDYPRDGGKVDCLSDLVSPHISIVGW
jgi:hypothetical protein